MTTIGETISRIRNTVKGVIEDAFLTDRFLYSLIIKYASVLVRRQDNENKILRIQSLFEILPCVYLTEVSKIDACCAGIKTNCTIMRTKDPIPEPMEGSEGPLIRAVTSIDGSIVLVNTNPTTFTAMANQPTFKYNKSQYYWYLEGHIFFPNLDWEAVRIDGMFIESTAKFHCDVDQCSLRQNDRLAIPEFLFAEVEQMAIKDLTLTIQLPQEGSDDNQSPLRT